MPIIFHGRSLRLVGLPLKVGDRARDVRVIGNDLSPVLPLGRSPGKLRLFLTVPSVDIPGCSATIRQFSQILTPSIQTFGDSLAVFLISADLPFAQIRWQVTEEIGNITLLSDYRDMDFARNWGLLIQELGLLASAVFVIDPTGVVTYQEIASEFTTAPDYEAVLAHLSSETMRES